jgi:LAO/AO transport system kinase
VKPFFVYMLRCADGSFYVGHTDELERRVAQHQAGEIEGYTRQRRPVEVVWAQETATREEALAAELRIKGWGRAKKEALIRDDWSAIQRHAWGTRKPLPEHLRAGPSTVQPEVSKAHTGGAGASIPQPERGGEPGTTSTAQPEVSKAHAYADQVRAGSRRGIAKAITLLESTRADDRQQADALLNTLLPHTGGALRLGISGVPGVGKSTFIEALGLFLIDQGHRVAVLTIDPSSTISGGSILGDKTRMEKLSVHDAAYIRPSPASGTLGGVAEKTREAMLVCEAAGYDVVIVETVGVGQSETAVASMTDMFVLLQLPNAGDDLQAIKKGVMEIADLVVINKADLDPDAATRAEATITSALRIFSFHGHTGHWTPKVMQTSALKGRHIDTFWQQVEQFQQQRRASGEFDSRRKKQALSWMWDIVQARLQADFKHHPAVREALPQALRDVAEARIAPSSAARSLLDRFERD